MDLNFSVEFFSICGKSVHNDNFLDWDSSVCGMNANLEGMPTRRNANVEGMTIHQSKSSKNKSRIEIFLNFV